MRKLTSEEEFHELKANGKHVFMFSADWCPDCRIIECRDGIQWILQRRKGQSSGRPEWRGQCFCRTRAGLLICIREKCGPVDTDAMALARCLPERMGGRP